MRNYFALLFIGLCMHLTAQTQDEVVTEGGKTFCVHKIQKGENLYRLSLAYKVKVKDIKDANPGLGDNLSLDQPIKIPCSKISKESTKRLPKQVKPVQTIAQDLNKKNTTSDEFKGNYIFHKISPKETVYSILKRFNITETQFYKDNPDVKRDGLKIGTEVKILQVEDTAEDERVIERYFVSIVGNGDLNTFGADSTLLKDTNVFQLAVMLPFQYERNVEYLKKFNEDQQPKLYNETRTFVELYQGIKMAVDSITKLGMNVQLFVYDTKADTNEIKKIIQKPEAKYFDLVIGPGYTSTFLFAAKYLKQAGIPMISPLSKKDKIIKGNPNVIKVVPSYEDHLVGISKYVNDNYLKENIIISMATEKDRQLALKMQRDIMAQALMNDSSANLTTSIVKGDYGVHAKLIKGKKNIVILVNNKEAFTTKLATKLVPKSTKYEIYLFGTEDLKKYKNIEVAYWDSLNIHVSSGHTAKYGYPITDQFISAYFKKFYSEPSKFALSGYDLTMMVLKQTLKEKKYSHASVAGHYYIGGWRDYQFKYNGDQNGISNKAISIYRYHDFKFIKVDD